MPLRAFMSNQILAARPAIAIPTPPTSALDLPAIRATGATAFIINQAYTSSISFNLSSPAFIFVSFTSLVNSTIFFKAQSAVLIAIATPTKPAAIAIRFPPARAAAALITNTAPTTIANAIAISNIAFLIRS